MSYQRRQNLSRKATSKDTEVQRHLRNARKARVEEAIAHAERAIEFGKDKMNVRSNAAIQSARNTLDQAEAICDLLCEQNGEG